MPDEHPKLKRGRPKTTDPKVPITAWVSTREFDRIATHARQHDQSISSIVRAVLRRRVPSESPR